MKTSWIIWIAASLFNCFQVKLEAWKRGLSAEIRGEAFGSFYPPPGIREDYKRQPELK